MHIDAPAVLHASGTMVRTLPQAFQETVRLAPPDAIALRTPGDQQSLSWSEYGRRVERIAAGLNALGVRHGDTVGIMLTNRPEFHLADTATMHVGAVPFSIYNTSSPEQISFLFGNAENWVIVTERRFLDVIRLSGVAYDHLICVDDPAGHPNAHTLAELETLSLPHFDFEAAWRAVEPHDLATLMYTSGTTGAPKGVELTHANIIAQLEGLRPHIDVDYNDRIVSYLPAAHIADRVTSHYSALIRGMQVTSVEDLTNLVAALQDTHPTVFFGVPRVWQKIKGGIEARLAIEPNNTRRRLAHWAFHTGQRTAEAKLTGSRNRARLRNRIADALILRKVRRALGLDQVRIAVSSAAPLPPETLTYFYGLGIRITEAWGLSETTGVVTTTTPDQPLIGSVGRPLAGTDLHIASDGEVYVRGPIVTRGYRDEPDLTAAAIDKRGWLATGDIAKMDHNGNITIVDRKKEMIISDSGKNIAPSNVENAIKAASSLIGHVMATGDGQPYVTALIVLDPDAVEAQARALGVQAADVATLAARPGIVNQIIDAVRAGNARLSRPEQIKRFVLLSVNWELGGEEITPKGSLRRQLITEKYRAELDGLYATPPAPTVVDLAALE